MNWVVSSIQPVSSTAPGRRNISQGERASLETQEAAARDIGHAFDHAIIGTVHQQHLADHAGRGARNQRGQRGHRRLLDTLGWNDHTQHEASLAHLWKKRGTVISLLQSK
jgi:hypothetical protein